MGFRALAILQKITSCTGPEEGRRESQRACAACGTNEWGNMFEPRNVRS